MAPKWRAGSVLTPEELTCDLASLRLHVAGWHCGIARPFPCDPGCSLFRRRLHNCLIKRRHNSLGIPH